MIYIGFIAALDQSGGSTPKALRLYGIKDDEYTPGEKSMFDQIHKMRTRIMTSPKCNGDRILGAILFEDTMKRKVNGIPSAEYLWREKHINSRIKFLPSPWHIFLSIVSCSVSCSRAIMLLCFKFI